MAIIACIGTNDFRLVWEKAGALSGRWDSIGIMLGLSPNKLEEIDADSKTARACLRKVFDCWLKRDYDYKSHGVPTLRMLCDCIKSTIGGANPVLADEITKKYSVSPIRSSEIPTPSDPSFMVSPMGYNPSVSVPTLGGPNLVSAGDDTPGLSSTENASKGIYIYIYSIGYNYYDYFYNKVV